MAMDFFAHQERARQRTGLLLFYFSLAVLLTVVAVNAAVFLVFNWPVLPGLALDNWLAKPAWLWISFGTLAIIGVGSLTCYLQLRDGGHAIADAVRARRVDPDTTDAQERMLLNIVEEMALASGTPAPTTYVMDNEPGINAFVAGFEPTEAVLVVTKSALDAFNRDQMQGVIGHEYSHILNGDMRMNVQLYAILSGILLLGRFGEFLLRSTGLGRNRRRDNKGVGLMIALVLIALALMVIGYLGLFFGRLIKAAISRQRELLADASSVQFTRNPQGLAEALLKIRNAADGSLLENAHAEDMSHMCFSLPVKMHFSALLATHPPLDERIAAIDPSMMARDRARARMARGKVAPAVDTPSMSSAQFSPAMSGLAGSTPAPVTAAGAVAASIGQLTPTQLAYGTRLHDSIPASIRDLLRTAAGARLVTYGIALAGSDARHEADAIRVVAAGDSDSLANRLKVAMPELRRLGTRLHLPCHDLALPALRPMSDGRKRVFLTVLEQLVRIDQRITLREYLMLSLMRKHLSPGAGAARPVRHRSYGSVVGPVNVVISMLCHASGCQDTECTDLHARVMRGFAVDIPLLLPMKALTAIQLHEALTELADLSPLLKKPLLDACLDCINHDGKLQVAELELLRAVGEALDCPVPPLPGLA
ncbi:MAG: M48 family metallopeptidase [Pseudomonadota bacterium]